jgi:hypothetical protein
MGRRLTSGRPLAVPKTYRRHYKIEADLLFVSNLKAALRLTGWSFCEVVEAMRNVDAEK